MKFVLSEDLFTNGEYVVPYGNKAATFTIIDEEYGDGERVVRVDRIICTVRTYDDEGGLVKTELGSLVIAIGDANVLVTTDNIALRGKLLSKSNMEGCTVELYE